MPAFKVKHTRGDFIKKHPLNAPERREVAQIAKKVVERWSETKEKIYKYDSMPQYIGGGTVSFNSVGYGGSAILAGLLTGINQGAGDAAMIGNRLKVMNVRVHFVLQNGDVSNNIRLMLVSNKKQCDKSTAAAALTQILSNAGSSADQFGMCIDTDTYKVHFDKTFVLRTWNTISLGAAIALNEDRVFTKSISFKDGFITEWDQNREEPNRELILVAISDSAAIGHPGVIAGFVKVSFKDS